MTKIRSIICREISDDITTLRLEEIDLPAPGPGDVRVTLRACAVGFPDILTVQGKYQHKPPLPFAPGTEAAGDVAELGSGVDGVSVGDRVVFGMRSGGYAEAIVVPASAVRPIPEGMDYVKAAAYPSAYLTAYVALARRGDLKADETLLVHGAAGGVGLAAVEVGKLMGATVIATAGSDEKLKVVSAKGADHVINYTLPDGKLGGFREKVKELTGGRGADVIYDPVGGDVFEESLRCIAWGGRLLVIGFTSGRFGMVSSNIPLIKGFSVVGVRAGEYGRRDPEAGRENVRTLARWAAEGKVDPHVCATYPLERAVEAMQLIANRKAVGRVVLTMNDD